MNFLSLPLTPDLKSPRPIVLLNYEKGKNDNSTCDTLVTAAIVRPNIINFNTQAEYLATSFHKIPNHFHKSTLVLFSGHPLLESNGDNRIAVWVGCSSGDQRPQLIVNGRYSKFSYYGFDLGSIYGESQTVSRYYMDPDPPLWSHQVPTLPAKPFPKVRARLPEGEIFLYGRRLCYSCPVDWI